MNTDNRLGAKINWSINANTAGNYNLTWRYTFANSGARPMNLAVNGMVVHSQFSFPTTNTFTDWRTSAPLEVPLKAGQNYVQLIATGYKGLPNIDSLMAGGNGISAGDCATARMMGFVR